MLVIEVLQFRFTVNFTCILYHVHDKYVIINMASNFISLKDFKIKLLLGISPHMPIRQVHSKKNTFGFDQFIVILPLGLHTEVQARVWTGKW